VSVIYNRGLYYLQNNAISGSTDIRALVIAGASVPGGAQDPDLNFVSELLAVSGVVEAAATNYARQDLAGVALAEDDSGDRTTLTATAPTINSVGAGETWRAVAYYIEGANDAARTLIALDTPASTLPTNGGNITLPALSIITTDATP
jgi:hypothetical protein